VTGALDSPGQLALFTFGQAGALARFNLAVLVDVALQGLKILVVKKRYVSPVFEYLCHYFSLEWDVVEIDRFIAELSDTRLARLKSDALNEIADPAMRERLSKADARLSATLKGMIYTLAHGVQA